MDSTKDFKRTTLPFDTPVPISRIAREQLENSFGQVRAANDRGLLIIKMKKHKNEKRELVCINTNVSPPTIEFRIEDEES
jgi:hypothetical protein